MTVEEQLRLLTQNHQQLSLDQKRLQEDFDSRRVEEQALKSIVFQLDETYTIEGNDEELELKILRKISNEVSELIESNRELKFRCEKLQSSMFSNST